MRKNVKIVKKHVLSRAILTPTLIIFFILFYIVLFSSCRTCKCPAYTQIDTKTGIENTEKAVPDIYANVLPELKACIAAHGGLDLWRSFGAMEYDRLTDTNDGEE